MAQDLLGSRSPAQRARGEELCQIADVLAAGPSTALRRPSADTGDHSAASADAGDEGSATRAPAHREPLGPEDPVSGDEVGDVLVEFGLHEKAVARLRQRLPDVATLRGPHERLLIGMAIEIAARRRGDGSAA
jgi:hypothetical protein